MEKVTLVFTNQEVEVIFRGLLELPSKFSLPVIQEMEKQLKDVKQDDKKESDETSNIKNV